MTAWTEEDFVQVIIEEFDLLGILPHSLPNAIGMWPNEQECLVWCAMQAPVGGSNWWEVGSFCGGSAILLGLTKGKAEGSVFAVDVAHKPIFDLNLKRSKLHNIKKVQATGIKALEENSAPIGFLFLDGFHSFNSVVSEFEAARLNLMDDAIIAFHDVSPMMYTNSHQSHIRNCYEYACDNWDGLMTTATENFRIDEAVSYICTKYEYKIIDIPIRKKLAYHKETGLNDWVRGKTSPHNAFTAIRKQK